MKTSMDFLRPGLKTGVGNGIFWSEIGSGFGDTGGTPHQKFQRVPPPPPGQTVRRANKTTCLTSHLDPVVQWVVNTNIFTDKS